MIPSQGEEDQEYLTKLRVKQAIRKYQKFATEHPNEYAEKFLGVTPWSKQREILEAVADPNIPNISVRSGNGVGKTFLASVILAQYSDTHSPSYAVVTGASWQGVIKTVWATFRGMHHNAPVDLGGDVIGSEWRRGNMWGAFCVSPDAPENISGFRTKNGALVLIDEASAISKEVYDAIIGVCSAKGSKIVMLGNPLRPEGAFYDTFTNTGWKNFSISSIEASEQGIQGLASPEWIEARRKEWGEDSPMWKARVLGEFPEDSENILIPLSDITARRIPNKLSIRGTLRLGIDVSRFGGDKTVFAIRDDRCIQHYQFYTKRSTMETAGRTQNLMEEWEIPPENVAIDDTGLGGGVVDRLHELGLPVVPVDFGSKAYEVEKFVNRRTELYWNMRKAIIQEATNPLYLPEEFSEIIRELAYPRYDLRSDQRIELESKKSIKKRLGNSPDFSDALALTYDVYGNYGFF